MYVCAHTHTRARSLLPQVTCTGSIETSLGEVSTHTLFKASQLVSTLSLAT